MGAGRMSLAGPTKADEVVTIENPVTIRIRFMMLPVLVFLGDVHRTALIR